MHYHAVCVSQSHVHTCTHMYTHARTIHACTTMQCVYHGHAGSRVPSHSGDNCCSSQTKSGAQEEKESCPWSKTPCWRQGCSSAVVRGLRRIWSWPDLNGMVYKRRLGLVNHYGTRILNLSQDTNVYVDANVKPLWMIYCQCKLWNWHLFAARNHRP